MGVALASLRLGRIVRHPRCRVLRTTRRRLRLLRRALRLLGCAPVLGVVVRVGVGWPTGSTTSARLRTPTSSLQRRGASPAAGALAAIRRAVSAPWIPLRRPTRRAIPAAGGPRRGGRNGR